MSILDRRLRKLESATKPEREVTVLFAPEKGASDAETAKYRQDLECAQAAGHRVLVVGFVGVPPPGVEAMSAGNAYLEMCKGPTTRPLDHRTTPIPAVESMTAAEAYRRMTLTA